MNVHRTADAVPLEDSAPPQPLVTAQNRYRVDGIETRVGIYLSSSKSRTWTCETKTSHTTSEEFITLRRNKSEIQVGVELHIREFTILF